MREAEKAGTVQPGDGEDSCGVLCDTCRRMQRRKTRSPLVVSSDRMRGSGHKLKYKNPFKYKEKQNIFSFVQ